MCCFCLFFFKGVCICYLYWLNMFQPLDGTALCSVLSLLTLNLYLQIHFIKTHCISVHKQAIHLGLFKEDMKVEISYVKRFVI